VITADIDKTELSIGGKHSGIILRYGGKIRGGMILVRGRELSLFNFSSVSGVSWNYILRVPGLRTRTW